MIVVRPARPDELGAAGAVTLAAYEQYREHFTDPDDWEEYATKLRDPHRRDRVVEHLVAVDEGRIVGAVSILTSREEDDRLWFRYLAVAPEARRRGIARDLFDAVVTFAREAGASELGWKTASYMQDARRFYESLGHPPAGPPEKVARWVELYTYRVPLR